MALYELPPEEVALLRKAHKQTRDPAVGDRIKAVVLLSQDWDAVKVAEALSIDERTVRQYFYTYKRLGLNEFQFNSCHGRKSYLSAEAQAELKRYLNEVTPATSK